jgi:hypothetical protein
MFKDNNVKTGLFPKGGNGDFSAGNGDFDMLKSRRLTGLHVVRYIFNMLVSVCNILPTVLTYNIYLYISHFMNITCHC